MVQTRDQESRRQARGELVGTAVSHSVGKVRATVPFLRMKTQEDRKLEHVAASFSIARPIFYR